MAAHALPMKEHTITAPLYSIGNSQDIHKSIHAV